MNQWHVYEACKAFARMGAFDGLSLDEQYILTRTWARAMGATEETTTEGWQEYQSVRKSA